MPALSAADILHVWEVGRGQSAVDRALTVLECACPERRREALARLPLGARDRLLLEARGAALGPALDATAECPACGETVEFGLGVDALLGGAGASGAPPAEGPAEGAAEGVDPPRAATEAGEAPGSVLTAEGYRVRYRLLDSTDLLAAGSGPDLEAARLALVERCVVEARREGAAVAPAELPAAVVAALAERLARDDPGVETLLDLTCPACGAAWQTELDLARFVWEELRGQARHLLDDVDTLARAYGWSEAEILALAAERRRAYVERAI